VKSSIYFMGDVGSSRGVVGNGDNVHGVMEEDGVRGPEERVNRVPKLTGQGEQVRWLGCGHF
jgi:hypothetical protein